MNPRASLRLIPAILALSAAGAVAQTGACAYTQPYMYLWNTPSPTSTIDTAFASQMVRDFVDPYDDDPATAGQNFAALALYQINTSHTTDANHVCLVLQNFGMWKGVGQHQVSLINTLDAVNPAPSWPNVNSLPDFDLQPYMQPWMVHGHDNVGQWMADFIAAYQTANGPTLTRVQFDSEVYLSSCCE